VALIEVYAVNDHLRERMDIGSVHRPGARESALHRVLVFTAWGGRWAQSRVRFVNTADRAVRHYEDVTKEAVSRYVDKHRSDKEAAKLVERVVKDTDAIEVECEVVEGWREVP